MCKTTIGTYKYHKCYLEFQNLRTHYGKVIPKYIRKPKGEIVAKYLLKYWDGEYDGNLLPGHSDPAAKHRRIMRLRQQNQNRNNNNMMN